MAADVVLGEDVLARVRRLLSKTGYLTNGIGATVVVAFMLWLAPNTLKHGELRSVAWRSIPMFFGFMSVALPLGNYLIQRRPLARIERWLAEHRPATKEDRERVLGYPRQWALRSFGVWVLGALSFFAVNVAWVPTPAFFGAVNIAVGGLTACSLQYVLVERIMRPITAVALAAGPAAGGDTPGVAARLSMAWLLTTGVPQIGIASFSILGLVTHRVSTDRVIATALFLSIVAMSIGLVAMLIAARSVAAPLETMRDAMARVERGDVHARVDVDDGSEIGLLQAGFNRMSVGLAEREQLREAFGTYVDPELTERVLREGTDLSGEEVELSVLFMDVRDFTGYAERSSPREVVARLNELYAGVVPLVLHNGGHANKFIGDGLLAVFGAPNRLEKHASSAVAAARDIVEHVRRTYAGDLRVGVGVNSGAAVVGTIGGGGRLDFTVIGDTVNTASRVESATKETGDDLLITEATLQLLDGDPGRWVERPPIDLKGKQDKVRLFAVRPVVPS